MRGIVKARQLLRSPWVITGELSALVLLAVISTLVPQEEAGLPAARVPELVRAAGLSRIFTSVPFLATVALAAASLSVVLFDQWARLLRLWTLPVTEAAFRGTPLRIEFDRAATVEGVVPSTKIVSRGRLGLGGSPVFHLGLMALLAAGLVRGLSFREAAVSLFEGETLPAEAASLAIQQGGPLSRPLSLPSMLRLLSVTPEVYGSGQLRGLSTSVEVDSPGGRRTETVAINRPLSFGATTLYVRDSYGPAALWGFEGPGGPVPRAVLLRRQASEGYGFHAAAEEFPGGLIVRTRVLSSASDPRPGSADIRVLQFGVLVAAGRMRPGQRIEVPGGTLTLVGLVAWADFRAARDHSVPIAYLGFALAGTGALLMFLVIRVDEMVLVTPAGAVEHVVVALRVQRFGPLFRERLAELAQREGAPPAC